MSASPHTPGPWTHVWHGRYIDSGFGVIGELYSHMGSAEATANGNLIAAAPDLFAAVKRAKDVLECAHANAVDDHHPLTAGYFSREIDSLKAVIAKAEGGKDGNAG